MDFTGRRVLITGSSRGIGQAAARVFHEAGARVAVNGRTKQSSEAGVAALGDGARLVASPGDVGTVEGCETVVAAAVKAFGGLDVLVNSAGLGHFGTIEECDEAFWDAMHSINLKGTYFTIRAALPHLRASKGNVVNVASDAGLIGQKGLTVYCATKGGVVVMTKAMALELAPDVRVNCVCPGYVDTDMVRRDGIEKAPDPAAAEAEIAAYAPLNTIARPEEIGKAIAYLASDDARFVTGAAFQIDGGSTAGQAG